jgi:hypothetical protein
MDDIQECMAKNKTVDEHIASLNCEYDVRLLDKLITMEEEATEKASANEEKAKEEKKETGQALSTSKGRET